MIWALLLACGGDESSSEPTVVKEPVEAEVADADPTTIPATDDWPTADQLILWHQRETQQCEILKKNAYRLKWKSETVIGQDPPRSEEVMHQGQPGHTYARVHQQREPALRFAAFGKSGRGDYWSASDGGIQPNLGDEAAATLGVGLDPTTTCNSDKRWKKRDLIAAETWNERPIWKVLATFSNDTTQTLFFDRETKLLLAIDGSDDKAESLTTYGDYLDFNGIKWPSVEKASRTEKGPKGEELTLTTTMALKSFAVDPDDYVEIGPSQVAAILRAASTGTQ